jgi:hypothetical protein
VGLGLPVLGLEPRPWLQLQQQQQWPQMAFEMNEVLSCPQLQIRFQDANQVNN